MKTGVDVSYVSRLLEWLGREGLLTRVSRGPVEAVDRARLIRRWTDDYSVLKSNEILVRFVADTDRTVIPESVSVLESQYGEISVQVCQAVMSGSFEVAKNRQGQPVRSWVQTAVRVNKF